MVYVDEKEKQEAMFRYIVGRGFEALVSSRKLVFEGSVGAILYIELGLQLH